MAPQDWTLNVGIVGLGKMGIMHACLLNTLPNVHVTALCDKSRLMRALAKRVLPKAAVTDSLEKFAGLGLDAIYVLTPIPIHYPLIKEICDCHLADHVFVEKTLSGSYKQSQELTKLAQDHLDGNMVGYMKRFAVTFNQAKSLLDKHAIGDLLSFSAYAFSSDFSDVPEGSTMSKARGGALEDLGSHVVDLAVWFFGDLSVDFAQVNSSISGDSEDDVSFGVTGRDNLQGIFEVSWRKSGYRMPEFGLSIHGTKGALKVNDDEVELEFLGEAPKRYYRHDLDDNTIGFFLGGPEYYREDKHFIDSIFTGETCRSSFENTLQVDYLLEQARRQSGK